jgi:hypothetical protein
MYLNWIIQAYLIEVYQYKAPKDNLCNRLSWKLENDPILVANCTRETFNWFSKTFRHCLDIVKNIGDR